ncbi:MAG: Gfo/Idh/MocA family oxidoreductase, partial [Actinomycetota bacterium]
MTTTRWGIAATGGIAASMAETLRSVDGAEIVAVGSRTQSAADAFAERFEIPRAHGSHDALVADPDVDVVYVASPHNAHRDMTIAALDAG